MWRALDPAPRRSLVPAAAARVGGALQPRARRQRRAEDHGHHLDAADRCGHIAAATTPCRSGSCSRATARSRWARCSAAGASSRPWASASRKLKAGRRLLRGDRRRDHAVSGHRARRPGFDHAHDHRRHRRRRLGAEAVSGAVGGCRQYRVGVDFHDPVLGVRRGSRVVAGATLLLNCQAAAGFTRRPAFLQRKPIACRCGRPKTRAGCAVTSRPLRVS